MRRRLLLLGVGIASLGAIFASAVLANPTSTSPTTASGSVAVQAISGLSVALTNQDTIIPANGSAYKVADVMAGENDSDYNIAATGVAVTTQGTAAGTCTGITLSGANITSTQYTISATTNLNDHTLLADSATADTDVGDLSLTLPVTVGNNCVVTGAVVTVTFQAQ